MNDTSRTGFRDSFDGSTPLRHNWARVQGGGVTVDCQTLDTVLCLSSETSDSECNRTWASFRASFGLVSA